MGLIIDVVDAVAQRVVDRPRAQEKKVPAQASMAFTDSGRQGKANVKLFRYWSEHSELVRGAIDIRRGQIGVAEWDIVPADPELEYSKPLQAQIKRLFDTPNPSRNSFRNFTEPVAEDILVLDAGSIEKVRNLRGEIAQLSYVDGGEVRVAKYWDGEETTPRYFWYPDSQKRAEWRNDDFVYIMSRPATYRVVGLSAMEVLKLTIDAELGATAYNTRQVTSAVPDGMLDLGEGVRGDQVEKFKSYWLAEIAGKGATAIIGGSKGAKWLPFRQSNRDMQFTEWQDYLLRKIALVFGLSAQDLNSVADINRANSQVLQENTDDRGLRPLLGNVQDYYTREIVWDKGFGGQDNNLAVPRSRSSTSARPSTRPRSRTPRPAGSPSGRSTSCGRRTASSRGVPSSTCRSWSCRASVPSCCRTSRRPARSSTRRWRRPSPSPQLRRRTDGAARPVPDPRAARGRSRNVPLVRRHEGARHDRDPVPRRR
jgi:hypothetical protein